MRQLLAVCEDAAGEPVEIEFALTAEPGGAARFGFLQVRPLLVVHETVIVDDADLEGPGVLAASRHVLGNGADASVRDVVYVKAAPFEVAATPAIAGEVEAVNDCSDARGQTLPARRVRPLGDLRPVGRRAGGVGADLRRPRDPRGVDPRLHADLSQGSHFFHNLTSFSVLYFSLDGAESRSVDWGWLDAQPAVAETRYLRHVRLDAPLSIKVDGRSGRGVITHHD